MNQEEYSVYKPDNLINVLNTVNSLDVNVIEFFKNFSFNKIVNQNIEKGNSAYVFKNVIKEDTTKSKIITALNKLNQQNLSKITQSIREIVFQTFEELNELVYQCINKIKRDNEQTRPLVGALCNELLTTYFITSNDEKIYFRKLLLTAVKNDYIENTDYNSENWTKEKGEKSMILLGVLFNTKIIDNKVMSSILNDFRNKITYKENGTQEDYEIVEKSIHQLSYLLSTIILNEENIKVYDDLDVFLTNQMNIYEEKKCISKKIRLICKNSIEEILKYRRNYSL